MAPKQKMLISSGDVFGSLQVLSEVERNKHGHRQYLVRCACGKEYTVDRGFLFDKFPRCRDCAEKSGYRNVRKYHLWDVVGHWLLCEEPIADTTGLTHCKAICLSCGCESSIIPAAVKHRKSWKCKNCPPNYFFRIEDDGAYGVLPGGEQFIIDIDDIPRVSEIFWHMEKDGYIISAKHGKTAVRLHNFIMNVSPKKKIHIDHINRNRSDCRKCNLRLVTAQQNCMNSSVIQSSATGLRGVTFDKAKDMYIARIGLNDGRIHLGSSKDPVVCAQMYNCAAPIIFGKFAGELNDVPEPPEWIKKKVEKKCKPYMIEAMIATQPCGIFYAKTEGEVV